MSRYVSLAVLIVKVDQESALVMNLSSRFVGDGMSHREGLVTVKIKGQGLESQAMSLSDDSRPVTTTRYLTCNDWELISYMFFIKNNLAFSLPLHYIDEIKYSLSPIPTHLT